LNSLLAASLFVPLASAQIAFASGFDLGSRVNLWLGIDSAIGLRLPQFDFDISGEARHDDGTASGPCDMNWADQHSSANLYTSFF